MPSAAARRTAVEALLADAALFNLLARVFTYPDPAQVAEVNGAFGRVLTAKPHADRSLLRRAADAWLEADADALPGVYVRHFLAGSTCSLHETAYGDGRRIAGRPVELADVQGFYEAFGFGQSARHPDLPDHLCAELEFLSLLLLKEAYARHGDWPRRAALTRAAAAAFLRDHLGRWIPSLARAIAEHDAEPYASLAALLDAAVAAQCRRRRVTPQPAEGRLPADPMQDDVLECGAPERVAR
jgi:nitrate reductase assembly molybdenum cofactor insertion protein NarJ